MSKLTAEMVGSDEGGWVSLIVKPSQQTVAPPPRPRMEILTREEILRRRQASEPKQIEPIKKKPGWPKGKKRK